MDLGNTGNSIYSIDEFEVIWPKDLEDKKLFKIEHVGFKTFMPRSQVVKQLFYPNMNDRFEINGTKLGFLNNKCMVMPNTTMYRLKNECVLATYYRYYQAENEPLQKCLLVKTKLTHNMREILDPEERVLILQNAVKIMFNMVPEEDGQEDISTVSKKLWTEQNHF